VNLSSYLGLLHEAERTLADAFRQVASAHGDEPDVHFLCLTLAQQCDAHQDKLSPVIRRYGESSTDHEPERLQAQGLGDTRTGPMGLLRDLQDVHMLGTFVVETWKMVGQAGQALHDLELLEIVQTCSAQTSVQTSWLETRMKQAAPQVLVVAGR
jgi:hypothetical protein